MKKINVKYPQQKLSYPIYIQEGILDSVGKYISELDLSDRAVIISDNKVGDLYGSVVTESLDKHDIECDLFTVPQGESSKSLDTCAKLFTKMIQKRFERGSLLIALGGGMVGDLAGFVAATFLRGIPFIQLPTSLLAQIDSSVGGKVAVNHPLGKNLIGAFYNPRLVLIDPDTLETLPEREIRAGMGEVIKYGLIWDKNFFGYLDRNLEGLIILEDKEVLAQVILNCVKVKANVVSKDMHEGGIRKILNFGHTIGHAIEASTDYGRFKHGETVTLGMQAEACISHEKGLLDRSDFLKVESFLERIRIDGDLSDIEDNTLVEKMRLDKKVARKKINFILLEGIGKAQVRDDVGKELIINSIKYLKERINE